MVSTVKQKILALIIIFLVLVEVGLCFWGPLNLSPKPSLMLTPPFQHGLTAEEQVRLTRYLELCFTRTRSFTVTTQSLIEQYYLERADNAATKREKEHNYLHYRRVAADLGIQRLAVPLFFSESEQNMSGTITLRDVASGATLREFSFPATSPEAFLTGAWEEKLLETFTLEAEGLSLFDVLFLSFLAAQLSLPVLSGLRKKTALLIQYNLLFGICLFLFAYLYALNANSDYVQRFIAESGGLDMAANTGLEQLYAVIRFIPLLLINLYWYILERREAWHKPALATGRTDSSGPVTGRQVPTLLTHWGLVTALFCGVLYGFAFPSVLSLDGLPLLAWFCLIPLFVILYEAPFRQGYFYALCFAMIQTLIINFWHSTYSFISLPFTMLVSLGEWLLFLLLFLSLLKFFKQWGFLAGACLWTLFDFLRSQGYIGYPWGYIGTSQYAYLPFIQLADLTGVWGLTFVIVLFNAGVSWVILGRKHRWFRPGQKFLPLYIALACVALTMLYGLFSLSRDFSRRPGQTVQLLLVQQNTDPRKHDYRLSFDTLVRLTKQGVAEFQTSYPGRVPDLIVWPEGGFSQDVRFWLQDQYAGHESRKLVDSLFLFQADLGLWLVTGTQDHEFIRNKAGEEERINYNSAAFISPWGDIEQIYHKMHLVPFTEAFPFKEQFPQIAAILDKFNTSNWTPGRERVIFEHPKFRFFTPICFEDVFPDDIRRFVLKEADVIVNLSNDYWALTPVEGKQHAVNALFRAVENRRPLVRSTCSGFTTSIDPWGRIQADSPPQYTEAFLQAEVQLSSEDFTVYTRLGDWFPGLLAIAVVLAGILKRVLLRFKQVQSDSV